MKANHFAEVVKRQFTDQSAALSEREKRVVHHLTERLHISRNVGVEFEQGMTFGQRVSDRIASFGGSWTFILLFCMVLIFWVVLNSFLLAKRGKTFDPYPYILLNLFLSMVAALQAPIILMAQNRQAARDRLDAGHDYEVNLKAELEIMALHEKLDGLRDQQWKALMSKMEEQTSILEGLAAKLPPADGSGA